MKKIFLLIILLNVYTSCVITKKEKYIFPEAMLPAVQKDYAEKCKIGKELYELNCAKCHNTGFRKQIVPGFTSDQLVGYTLRGSNNNHEESIPDSIVTEEELVYIMHYLNYRKK